MGVARLVARRTTTRPGTRKCRWVRANMEEAALGARTPRPARVSSAGRGVLWWRGLGWSDHAGVSTSGGVSSL